MRKKQAMHLDARYVTMVENAYYYCNPPPAEKTVKKKRPPLQEYIRKLLYKDLSKVTTEKVNPFKIFNTVFTESGVVVTLEKVRGGLWFFQLQGRGIIFVLINKMVNFFYWMCRSSSCGPVFSTASHAEQRESEMRIIVFCTLCWENEGTKGFS